MQFNHFANRVNAAHFEVIVELFKSQLGFLELRRSEMSIWMRQPGANIDIQFSQSLAKNRDEDKRGSQVSFITSSPRESLDSIASWCTSRGLKSEIGSWSDKEYFLDLPEAFVDFVIEAMTPDLAEYTIAL